jgi:hypothetical protein
MRMITKWFGWLLLLGLVGCGEDQLKNSAFPDIQATPEVITLTTLSIGESLQKSVTLRNAGGESSKLIITHIEFSNSLDPREFTKNDIPLPLTLRGRESITVQIDYAPIDAESDAGELLVRSNDPDQPNLAVPINTTEAGAEIQVLPPELNFGPVPGGTSVPKTVTVTNAGAVAVPITDIHLDPATSADFVITAGGDIRTDITLDTSLVVEVTYTPTGRDDDTGTLVIVTSNPDYPQILVPIKGTEPSPDIDVSRPNISFGAVDLGADSDVVDLVVTNMGTAPLSVDSVAFTLAEEGMNEQFRLSDLPESFPAVLGENESFTIGVSYHPRMDGRHRAVIEISSNDPDEPVVQVPIDGRVRVPCIQVTPESVNLGVVAQGVQSVHQPVLVTNCGDLPLTLGDLRVEGAPGFAWGWPEGQPEMRNLPPLSSVTVEVWFSNDGLAEGAVADANFLVENNTPDRPVVTVPLQVRGGGAPTCDLRLLGSPVNFGFVSRGTSRSRPIDALNVGTGNCEVRGEVTAFIGIGANPFIITGHLPRLVGPGQRVPVTVEFHPLTWGPMAGTLTVNYFNPYLMQPAMATANLNGVGGDSNIEVIPGHLDFGLVTAGDCASRTERVTVYNTGLVDLCITNIQLVGANCDEFVIVNRPVANMDGCIVVTRNRPADVELVYEPGNLGPDECDLVFTSDASDDPELHVPLTGTGTADRRQTDEFDQGSGQQVDVLFMIDNSGSMSEEQENLANNISDFIAGADQFQNDFQLGVVNSESEGETAGHLVSAPRIIRRSPQTEAQFQSSADVGIDSAQDERGLEAAHKALTDPNAFDTGVACQNDGQCMAPDTCVEGSCGGYNRGFLRDTAALEIIFLSDEEDQSPGTVNFYVDFFKSIKGFRNEARMHTHAIVGADDQGNAAACMSNNGAADAGRRYVEVAERTNGTVHSICADDFGADLRTIGNQAFGLQVQFFLSRPAAPGTVTVEVDGAPQADGWSFDQESNSVAFDEGSVPQPGAHIVISYEAQCFPRQNQ